MEIGPLHIFYPIWDLTDFVFFHKSLQMLKSYYDPSPISPKSFLLQSKHPQFLLSSITWFPASSLTPLESIQFANIVC